MAFTICNNHATTNGATAVSIVAAPATDEYRIVKTISCYNNDTTGTTFLVLLVDGATTRIVASSGSVAAGSSWVWSYPLCLDTVNKSIQIKLTGAKTTNDCDVTAHYLNEA